VSKIHEKVVAEMLKRFLAGFEVSERRVLPKAGVQGAFAVGKDHPKSSR